MAAFKVSYHTLGCKLNFAETSAIARLFDNAGCSRGSVSEADICVVNSCSVTEHAEKKCRNLIRRLHRINPQARIVVTGCYAELRPDRISSLEGVVLVIGNRDKNEVCARTLAAAGNGPMSEIPYGSNPEHGAGGCGFFPAYSLGDRTRSFLKVQDGCDYRCSYCTISAARGGSRNIPVAEAVRQAGEIAAAGVREIVITGVNTGDFGRSTGETFYELLRSLEKVAGIERYRISSVEPNLLTGEIIELCADSPKFMPHFHIPLQSGSDKVLRRMGRRYDTTLFRSRIENILSAIPNAFTGIDVIAGFPGESEEDFRATVTLLKELRPAYLHVFPFSERPGTPAACLPDKVQDREKTRRASLLESLCSELHAEFYARNTGKTAKVLFESAASGGYLSGYTENYLRVRTRCAPGLAGAVCEVNLGEADEGPVFTVSNPIRKSD